MNFTERYIGAKTLAFVTSPNVDSISQWKGHALRITVFVVGFGIYVLLFRGKGSSGGKWSSLQTNQKSEIESDVQNPDTEIKEINDDRSLVVYNDEICPICLEAPKIGVKATCGHLLCVECLANYCDVTINPAPLPCPLCRAPLNSIALACDFAIPMMLDTGKMSNSNAIRTQEWIRDYNNRSLVTSKRPLPMSYLTLFVNILLFFLIVGLIAARLEILSVT